MTPKDKHTEVAWQAKQREVKTGSVEKTVHSATSAINTASEIRSVMSHSETQEITGNHITREQQLQNMRLATQKYLQPENQVNTQSILPENTGHTNRLLYNRKSCGIRMNQIMYRNSLYIMAPVKNMRRKLHSSMHLFQRRIKYQKNRTDKLPGNSS